MMIDKLYTRQELKIYFNVSIYTIDNWLKKGNLNSIKIDNTVRVSQTQINEFLNNYTKTKNYE